MGSGDDTYSGLQVSAERLAALRDDELSLLFRDLLRAHAYKTGVPSDAAYVNTEDKAKDDGCDAWSEAAASPDEWLGPECTCWQLKAGVAGEPSRLKGEAGKRIPTETLSDGGRLVVVASGSTNGRKGRDDRLTVLAEEARALGLPTEKIDVIGSERLADWCNQHPALAWRLAGNTTKVVTLERWATSEQHRVQWQPSSVAMDSFEEIRRDLDLHAGQVRHLHIEGPPGVGKTRFALELVKGAPWSSDVVYVRQAAEADVGNIIHTVTEAPGAHLLLVVDEVQQHQLAPLRDAVGYAEGRVRLITIGHSRTPDPDRIPSIRIEPLADDQMATLVRAWHEGMPPEHVDFVVRFADGYVRLAQLAAGAVARNPGGSVRDLLDQQHIRGFLDGMLGGRDRRSLYVVAALSTVGWDGEIAEEGAAIAAHFGLKWTTVQAEVEQFDRAFGIAPRGGRRRYISPTPLAAHLAAEAWAAMPGVMRSLPDALPSDAARDSYFERIRTIATTPFAREFAIEDLRAFFDIAAFRTESDIKRWAALSAAAPLLAAKGALNALKASSVSERSAISGGSRRHLLMGLMELASREEAFREAAISVALLAEAENETYSNNATGEFERLYQIRLGGTAAPYQMRLRVADELLSMGRDSLTRIVVKGLAKSSEMHETRIRGLVPFGLPEQIEWRPKSAAEHIQCVLAAVDLLEKIHDKFPATRKDVEEVYPGFVELLWIDGLRNRVLAFTKRIIASSDSGRKVASAVLLRYVRNEERYWHRLSEEASAQISAELEALLPMDLRSRLEREVGTSHWDKEDHEDGVEVLASEVLGRPHILVESVPWLTSGEAADAWRFGKALADSGDAGALVELLMSHEHSFGPDLRFVLAVVDRAKARLGAAWFTSWVDSLDLDTPRQLDLLVESIWRVGATEESLGLVAERLRSVSRNSLLGLGYGAWYEAIDGGLLSDFLQKLSDCDVGSVVISIVDQATKRSHLKQNLEDLVIHILADAELVRSGETMVEYHWKELALRYIDTQTDLILDSILSAHATRGERSWFVKYSQIKAVLVAIAKEYPTRFWHKVRPYLESKAHRGLFWIGFPAGLFTSVPIELIEEWISDNVGERAPIIIRIVGVDFSDERSHAMMLLERFGGQPGVDDSFFATFVSGGWSGSASSHWYGMAASLAELAENRQGYFRIWANGAIQSLNAMGDRDRKREEEEEAIMKNR